MILDQIFASNFRNLHRTKTGLDSRQQGVGFANGDDIKLNNFKTSMTPKFIIILQNVVTSNRRKSRKSNYDRKLNMTANSIS